MIPGRGPDVRVLATEGLREEIASESRQAAKSYQGATQ